MKKRMLLFGLMMVLNACEKKETSGPMLLVGKWQLSAMQGSNGKWEDAPPNGVVLEIFADGSINYTTVDGSKIPGCCSPVPYKTEGDKTILLRFGGEGCELVRCMAIDPSSPAASLFWSVTDVDAQMLGVETSNGQRQMRFRKTG